MELLGGWNRVRRNLVGTFFLQARTDVSESEVQTEKILLEKETYSVPSAELEREYRTIEELDYLLEEARKDYAVKQKEFELRWKLCSDKNDFLQKLMSEFENYFNASKLKQDNDKQLQAKYEKQLEENVRKVNRMKKELARMEKLKLELEVRLENSEIYREFMKLVVEESNGQFEEVSHVIARYYELKDIREKFVEKTVKQVEKALQLEKELKEIIQKSKMENVCGKTYLSQLEDYKNQLQVSIWRRQDNVLALKEGLKRELLITHIPKTSIHNLYLLLSQEIQQPATLKENQFKEQLFFIQKYLKELVKLSDRTREFLECPSDKPLASGSLNRMNE